MNVQTKALNHLGKEFRVAIFKLNDRQVELAAKFVHVAGDEVISGKFMYSVYEDGTWLHSTESAYEAESLYNDVKALIQGAAK